MKRLGLNKHRVLLLGVLLGVMGVSGCSHFSMELKPWVKPYQRDRLALPYMSQDRYSLASEYMDHAYQSREGARGAEGGSGGGCGCN